MAHVTLIGNLVTVAVLAFITSWNNYILPLIMLNSDRKYPWPLGIMVYQGEYSSQWNLILAFITLTILPTIVLFLLWSPAGWAGLILTLWMAYFFRGSRLRLGDRHAVLLGESFHVVALPASRSRDRRSSFRPARRNASKAATGCPAAGRFRAASILRRGTCWAAPWKVASTGSSCCRAPTTRSSTTGT